MDSEIIHGLLEKYWKCETTLEEEAQLRSFFRSGSIPDSMREAAALFRHLDQSRLEEIPDSSFNKSVLSQLPTGREGVRKWLYNTMRIAAGIPVLVLAVWFIRIEARKTDSAGSDTYADPEMAFEETKKALLMISKSFNLAEKQARKVNLFNEAQNELRKDSEDEDAQKHM